MNGSGVSWTLWAHHNHVLKFIEPKYQFDHVFSCDTYAAEWDSLFEYEQRFVKWGPIWGSEMEVKKKKSYEQPYEFTFPTIDFS